MKKIIISSALSFVVLFTASTATAQDLAAGIFIHPERTRLADPETGQGYRIMALNEVNVQAARDFSRKYVRAEDITWVEGKNGMSVYFTFNGLKMRSTYSKTGKKEYTLKYYGESSMPSALRHRIKSNYYDYRIVQVTEVERKQITSYLVKVENDKEYLTLKVVDGEITLYEKVDKAG